MPTTQYQINPSCTACPLHKCRHPRSVCLKGKDGERGGLMIFTDYPDLMADKMHKPYVKDTMALLAYLLESMSIDPDVVTLDYTLRCYPDGNLPGQKPKRLAMIYECNPYRFARIAKFKPKAIVALGSVSSEAFTGETKPGEVQGRKILSWEPIVRDKVSHIWVGYSLNYIMETPGETPEVFRVLFKAAEEAGLKPKLNPHAKKFNWTSQWRR